MGIGRGSVTPKHSLSKLENPQHFPTLLERWHEQEDPWLPLQEEEEKTTDHPQPRKDLLEQHSHSKFQDWSMERSGTDPEAAARLKQSLGPPQTVN